MSAEKNTQSFSFETVACMIAAYESGASTLGMAAYNKMAQLDGKRTACAFQHQFRDVKARARELAEELKAEKGSPSKDAVTPKKRGMSGEVTSSKFLLTVFRSKAGRWRRDR